MHAVVYYLTLISCWFPAYGVTPDDRPPQPSVGGKRHTATASVPAERDVHSFANPEHIRVAHLDLSWDVAFDRKQLVGEALLSVQRTSSDESQPLVLDTRHLHIEKVDASADGASFQAAAYHWGQSNPVLGAALIVEVPARVRQVRIRYHTDPDAPGLQWLEPAQTSAKKHPFLFTQSEAIQARSWIPLQDSPAVRITYTARVKTPPGLVALMSAAGNPVNGPQKEYRFEMTQPIPSYLIALAVGDIAFRRVGERTGVYAEPDVVARAAWEFADLEKMVRSTEALYGPYRWGRYDVLVLPPSFPMGGMENPRLTFATPTILAGDRSLVSLICHELAHSWSGNLVSNATWRDFWLNEGFTVYLERRILEQVYGKERADMEAVLGRQDLEKEMATLPPRDQILHIDLKGRDPDEGFSDVPYEKGALFLRALEQAFGQKRLDAFLKSYFNHFAFHSIHTADFVAYLHEHLLEGDPARAARIDVSAWTEQPGIPPSAPPLTSSALTRVAELAVAWAHGKEATSDLPTKAWGTQEWLQFLRSLPEKMTQGQLDELDHAFGLSRRGNSEITFQWVLMAIQNHYKPAYPRLEEFLTSMGRRKFLKPLYQELVKTPEGKALAQSIYAKARPLYHATAVAELDPLLGWKP